MEHGSIYHIAIAVKDLKSAEPLFENIADLEIFHREVVEDQGVRATMLKPKSGEGTAIELLEALNEDSPIAKFIEKKGEGIHHICFYVNDLELKLKELKDKGVVLIDEKPRMGAYNTAVAFLHPKSTNGVLVELAELPEE